MLDVNDAFPLNAAEFVDTDGDGIGNQRRYRRRWRRVLDVNDAFPLDPAESVDTDNDGTGNNADTDDDGDGVLDVNDAFPLDAAESVDTDGDGTGNNADTDDDDDGVVMPPMPSHSMRLNQWTPTTTALATTPIPTMTTTASWTDDAFPLDPGELADTDGDGIGDNADPDDDNDGVLDAADAFPFNPTESVGQRQ